MNPTICDEILELTRQHNNTDLSNVSLMSACMYKLLQEPFFKNYKNFQLSNHNSNNLYICKGNTSKNQNFQGLESYAASSNKQDYKGIQHSDNIRIVNNDCLSSYQELHQLFFESSDCEEFFYSLKNKLQKDHEFLIKSFSINDTILYDLIALTCRLHPTFTENSVFDINLYIEKSKREWIEFDFKYDSFFFRDQLNLSFLSPQFFQLNSKERIQTIVEYIPYLNPFLKYFTKKENISELTKSEKIKQLKTVIQNNTIAKSIIQHDFNETCKLLINDRWSEFKSKTQQQYKEFLNGKAISFEQFYQKYKSHIDIIVDNFCQNNPFVKNSGINKTELQKHLISLTISDDNEKRSILFNIHNKYKIKDSFNIISISEEERHYSENLDLISERFCGGRFQMGLDANSMDGFRLIKQDDFKLYCTEDKNEDYLFLKLTYYGGVIGLAKLKVLEKVVNIELIETLLPFKKCGIAKVMMEEIADFCIANEKILINTMYTVNGGLVLPRVKKSLSEKLPDFVYIEHDTLPNNIEELVNPSNRMCDLFPKYSCPHSINFSFNDALNIFNKFKKEEPKLKEEFQKLIDEGIHFFDLTTRIEERNKKIINDYFSMNRKKRMKP